MTCRWAILRAYSAVASLTEQARAELAQQAADQDDAPALRWLFEQGARASAVDTGLVDDDNVLRPLSTWPDEGPRKPL